MRNFYILLLILVIFAGGIYLLVRENTALAPVVTEEPAAEVPAAAAPDFTNLPEAEAEALAERTATPFRVVSRDGEALMVTQDYVPGRVNAVVNEGVVTEYTIEGGEAIAPNEDTIVPSEETTDPELELQTPEPVPPGTHDSIIGLSEAEAAAYAANQNVSFRVGTREGVPLPLTMDYRPGRITAQIEGGVVIGYMVE